MEDEENNGDAGSREIEMDSPPIISEDTIRLLNSANVQDQLRATQDIRKLISGETSSSVLHINAVIQSGAVPKFVEFLQNDGLNGTLQFEAGWALTNIASGCSEHTRIVVEAGAVPILIRLLDSPNEDVQHQSLWALGNIAGDSAEFRDHVLDQGMLPPLLGLFTTKGHLIMMARVMVWALANLCRRRDPPPNFLKLSPCLPVLSRLFLDSMDEQVIADASFAFSLLAYEPTGRQEVLYHGVTPKLVDLLKHSSRQVVEMALLAISQLVSGNNDQTQYVIDCGVIPCLHHVLLNNDPIHQKNACFAVSNITSGTQAQIQAVLAANIFPLLIDILRGEESETRMEAAQAVANATCGGSPDQIRYLVDLGVMPLLRSHRAE